MKYNTELHDKIDGFFNLSDKVTEKNITQFNVYPFPTYFHKMIGRTIQDIIDNDPEYLLSNYKTIDVSLDKYTVNYFIKKHPIIIRCLYSHMVIDIHDYIFEKLVMNYLPYVYKSCLRYDSRFTHHLFKKAAFNDPDSALKYFTEMCFECGIFEKLCDLIDLDEKTRNFYINIEENRIKRSKL